MSSVACLGHPSACRRDTGIVYRSTHTSLGIRGRRRTNNSLTPTRNWCEWIHPPTLTRIVQLHGHRPYDTTKQVRRLVCHPSGRRLSVIRASFRYKYTLPQVVLKSLQNTEDETSITPIASTAIRSLSTHLAFTALFYSYPLFRHTVAPPLARLWLTLTPCSRMEYVASIPKSFPGTSLIS